MSIIAILPSWTEMMVAVMVGLVLFGGRLPQVAKDIGRAFFRFRNTMNDSRRESGIEDAIRDIRKDVAQPFDTVRREVEQAADGDFEEVDNPDSDSKPVDHPGD